MAGLANLGAAKTPTGTTKPATAPIDTRGAVDTNRGTLTPEALKTEVPKPTATDMQEGTAQVVANHTDGVEVPDDLIIYSCSPILNWRIHRFVFENGEMRLAPADADEFDRLIKGLPLIDQTRIKKIDVAAANKLIAARAKPAMLTGIDTTANTIAPGAGVGV